MEISQEQLDKLNHWCEDMFEYSNSDYKFKEQAVGALLKLFLIECNNVSGLSIHDVNPQVIEAGHVLLKKFKHAVEEKHTEWHSSSKYASHLNITPDHLNRTIKALIGKTAKEYVQNRIVIAAKRLLYFSDLSNKEIGYELGFSEASNFSAFFKKNSGTSPTNFRNPQRPSNQRE